MKHTLQRACVMLTIMMVSGCSNMWPLTKTHSHPMVQTDLTQPHASVYFIRPPSEHVLGYADNTLRVEVDDQRIVSLAKGEYTLLYMKPRLLSVTAVTPTQVRGRWEVEDVSRTREFEIKAGYEYFILLAAFDGEFRGADFTPKLIDRHQAGKVVQHLKAQGLAKRNPIEQP